MDRRFYDFGPLKCTLWSSMGCISLFGWRITWKDTRTHIVLFSEREGYDDGFFLGKWHIRFGERANNREEPDDNLPREPPDEIPGRNCIPRRDI